MQPDWVGSVRRTRTENAGHRARAVAARMNGEDVTTCAIQRQPVVLTV